VVEPGGGKWEVTRDDVGNPVAMEFPSGRQEFRTFDADGRLTGAERSDGSWVAYGYGENGLIDSVTGPGGTWEVEVDEAGRISAVTDPEGGTTDYVWDQAGQLAGVMLPDGSGNLYQRDELGRVVTARDGTGWGYEFTYDAAGRLIAITTGPSAP